MELPHSRLQFNIRLDQITKMLRGKKFSYIGKIVELPLPVVGDGSNDTSVTPRLLATKVLPASSRESLPSRPRQVAASPMGPSGRRKDLGSTRSVHRPASIDVQHSNGCTAIATAELKQRIYDSRNDTQITSTQIPIDRREPLPPTPTTPFYLAFMGNKPSSTAGSPLPDDQPSHMTSRNTKAVSRKSSFNVFRRVDSRSPLPRDVTASVMSVLHQNSHQRNDCAGHDNDDGDGGDATTTVATRTILGRSESVDKSFSRVSHTHSASAATMTEDRARQPLSASTTVRDLRLPDHSRSDVEDSTHERNEGRSKPSLHNAGLSPTLPAPSPLPEDSPHKYGLRDKMDTPELPMKVMVIPKARRKSSGLEIFNEAKSLQSASSFLNGLSTSRRRAESAADTSTSSWIALTAPSRPSSTRPSSRRPSSGFQEGEGRRNGHNFKSSGFAYSRPLNLTQIKCFRGHSRMLLSRNKHAPVECAVCHIDDDGEHFSCSWCAIRMCKYCRKDFAHRGMSALRERIKTAELGTSSENSSSESLVHHGRRLSNQSFPQIMY